MRNDAIFWEKNGFPKLLLSIVIWGHSFLQELREENNGVHASFNLKFWKSLLRLIITIDTNKNIACQGEQLIILKYS